MVLLEKLNKLEATITEQGITLGRIQDTTSFLNPGFPYGNKLKSPFSPSQPQMHSEVFQAPKGRWSSLEHFMTLPFVGTLFPQNYKYQNLLIDNLDTRKDSKLPNLHRGHIQTLIDHYITEIHPLHPVMEVAVIDRIQKELDEDGLCWTGETAIIMHLLAIGSILAGQDPAEYNTAAKRRMGFAVEKINVMAIQANYLEGYIFARISADLDYIFISSANLYEQLDHSITLQ